MFSRSRLTEARLHHAAYYLQRLRQWESAQQQSQHTEDDFAQDILQIQQAQSWCVDAGAMLPQAARLCSDFGLIETNTLESLFSAEAQLAWYQAALQAAQQLNDEQATLQHRYALALSYGRMSDYPNALAQLEWVQAHLSADTAPQRAIAVLNSMGDVLIAMGESAQAEHCYQSSLRLSDPHSLDHADSLAGLANVSTNLSRLAEAFTYCEQSLALYRQHHNTLRSVQVLGRMGELCYAQGNFANATQYIHESLRLAESLGYRRGQTLGHRNLAYIASAQGNLDEAERCYQRSLTFAEQLGDLREHAIILGGLGQLHSRKGESQRALACFEQSLVYCEQTGDQIGMSYMLINISDMMQQQGDLGQAIVHLERAQGILQRIGDPWGQAKVQMVLGEIAQQQGDFPRATGHYEQMLALVEQIGDERGQSQAHVGMGRAALATGDLPKARQAYQRALQQGLAMQAAPLILEALLGIAQLWRAMGEAERALELVGYILAQAECDTELRQTVEATFQTDFAAYATSLAQGATRDVAYFVALL